MQSGQSEGAEAAHADLLAQVLAEDQLEFVGVFHAEGEVGAVDGLGQLDGVVDAALFEAVGGGEADVGRAGGEDGVEGGVVDAGEAVEGLDLELGGGFLFADVEGWERDGGNSSNMSSENFFYFFIFATL